MGPDISDKDRLGTARARRAGLPRQSPARGAPDAVPRSGAALMHIQSDSAVDQIRAFRMTRHEEPTDPHSLWWPIEINQGERRACLLTWAGPPLCCSR